MIRELFPRRRKRLILIGRLAFVLLVGVGTRCLCRAGEAAWHIS